MTKRDDLDAWFAKADDILTDWHGDTDSMKSEPSKGEVDLPRGDSYYAQREYGVPTLGVVEGGPFDLWRRLMLDQMLYGSSRMRVTPQGLRHVSYEYEHVEVAQDYGSIILDESATFRPDAPTIETEPESPRDRALRLRHERNTGPVRDVRVDRELR